MKTWAYVVFDNVRLLLAILGFVHVSLFCLDFVGLIDYVVFAADVGAYECRQVAKKGGAP